MCVVCVREQREGDGNAIVSQHLYTDPSECSYRNVSIFFRRRSARRLSSLLLAASCCSLWRAFIERSLGRAAVQWPSPRLQWRLVFAQLLGSCASASCAITAATSVASLSCRARFFSWRSATAWVRLDISFWARVFSRAICASKIPVSACRLRLEFLAAERLDAADLCSLALGDFFQQLAVLFVVLYADRLKEKGEYASVNGAGTCTTTTTTHSSRPPTTCSSVSIRSLSLA